MLAGAAALAMSLSAGEARATGSWTLDPECRELVVLIKAKIETLEYRIDEYDSDSTEYYADLLRLKRLLWTLAYFKYASTNATCADLIAYLEEYVSQSTYH